MTAEERQAALDRLAAERQAAGLPSCVEDGPTVRRVAALIRGRGGVDQEAA